MADTTALKNRIRAAIKSNDNQEITGPVLQQALLDMVDELNGATETEASQRHNGDSTLQQGINTERQARIDADNALGQRITEEIQRAQEAENTINGKASRALHDVENLELEDTTGSQVQATEMSIALRTNGGSAEDPEIVTLNTITIGQATDQKAGLLNAEKNSFIEELCGKTNIYNGQSAGNYLVSYNSNVNPAFSIVAYSNPHFTAKIPLQKNATYILPFYDIAAYNFVVANSGGTIRAGFTGGKMSTESYAVGSSIQQVGSTLQFTCPDDNLYLFINLQFSTNFDYTDNFYLFENGTSILVKIGQINQKDAEQDNRIEALEEAIPHSTDIYNGQSAGNYLVSYNSNVNPAFNIVTYSNPHFTAKIPLQKNATYILPFYDIAAYNFVVANSGGTIRAGFTGGKMSTESYAVGSSIQQVGSTLQFTCPDDNLYLFINLQFRTNFDYTGSFYLLEGEGTIQDQINVINQKDAEQDNRIEALEETVGGDTRFSTKTIYVFGDSITWLGGDNCDGTRSGYEHKGWTEYFKERIRPLTMKSYARSGATLCCYSTSIETTSANYGSPHKDNIVWNQIKRMQVDINDGAAQPDYIIIAAGINDALIINSTDPESSFYDLNQAFQNALTGTAEDILNSNISTSYFGSKTPSECDSLLKTIRWIKEACISICPDAQIVLLTPLQAGLAPLSIQKQVSDIIEETGLYISATVINQRKQCGISRLQEAKGVHFTYDNTHTSIDGARRVGYTLAEILKSVFY